MLYKVTLLQAGITDVSAHTWQDSIYRVNRIHVPLKGMACYRDIDGEKRLEEGFAYLLINGYSQDLSLLHRQPYYHLYFDFQAVPPLHSREMLAVAPKDDPYLSHLLAAAQHLFENNISTQCCFANALPRECAAFEEAEQLLRVLLIHLQNHHDIRIVENEKIETAIRFIREHYTEQIQNADIAAALHIDKRYLIRLFTRYMAMPPYQYLTQCRIEHALDLLRSGKTVSEAAFLCGYQSETAFRIAFKRVMGCVPTATLK